MKTTVGIALALVAAASAAHAERTLDAAGGAVYVTSTDGTHALEHVRTPDGREARYEMVAATASAKPIHRVSHTSVSLAVHSGAGGSTPLTTSLFTFSGGEVLGADCFLRDVATGVITKPSAVRTIVLDPSDPGAVLLDASHVLLPGGQIRVLALATRSGGEVIVADYDVAGGPVRRTPLGFTPPIGSNKGSYVATPDGSVWAAFASPNGIRLFDLGDLSATGPLSPVQKGVIAGGAGFDPGSTHLGIIAILIGLVAQPAPAVSYQRGDDVIVSVLDGGAFRTVARQTVPPDASALIEPEGIFLAYYILPFIEQDNLYRLPVGTIVE
jgi:hypothetical protein